LIIGFFCLMSAIGTYYVFSRKKANLSDFFLSGFLYFSWGLNLITFLPLVAFYRMSSYWTPYYSNYLRFTFSFFENICSIMFILTFWAPSIVILVYQLLGSERRKVWLTTKLSNRSEFRVKILSLLLIIEFSFLLIIELIVLGFPPSYTTLPLSLSRLILRALFILIITFQSMYLGFLCAKPSLESYLHDLKESIIAYFTSKKESIQEYFGVTSTQETSEAILSKWEPSGSPVESGLPIEELSSPNSKSKVPFMAKRFIYCPSCKRPLEPNWLFCPHCGISHASRIKASHQAIKGTKPILFLTLLPLVYTVMVSGVFSLLFINTNLDLARLLAWLVTIGIFLVGTVSLIGFSYLFFRKRATSSDFFLSGLLFLLFGINLPVYISIGNSLYIVGNILVYIGLTAISPFLVLLFYKSFNYHRRKIMEATSLSRKAQFFLILLVSLLFFECLSLLSIDFFSMFYYGFHLNGIPLVFFTTLTSSLLGTLCIISALFPRKSLNQEFWGEPADYGDFSEESRSSETEALLEDSYRNKICPCCGGLIESDLVFCPHCGFERATNFKRDSSSRAGESHLPS
ncbi:MAG: zinc ribbon domain-containing protein, partial [Candidatus Hodarchaeota archaeon]